MNVYLNLYFVHTYIYVFLCDTCSLGGSYLLKWCGKREKCQYLCLYCVSCVFCLVAFSQNKWGRDFGFSCWWLFINFFHYILVKYTQTKHRKWCDDRKTNRHSNIESESVQKKLKGKKCQKYDFLENIAIPSILIRMIFILFMTFHSLAFFGRWHWDCCALRAFISRFHCENRKNMLRQFSWIKKVKPFFQTFRVYAP